MVALSFCLPGTVSANPDLYISEYIEGSSYNKALEIYNATATTLELSSYEVQFYFNGSTTPGRTINLIGALASGDVFVIAHGSADAVILNQADQTTGGSWFNGNDALTLLNGGAVIDAIGFIYRMETVQTVGNAMILNSSVDSRFNDQKNRPALAQTFKEISSNGQLTIAVNHLKSKGSSCAMIGDPDTGDGQGNCNQTRTDAANALVDWLATDPTNSADSNRLIIGDLNAYAKEDPITAITTSGYTNLIEALVGPEAYSYVFQGQAGYLDHALANASLASQVTGVSEWHINADEPGALDYNEEFKTDNQLSEFYNADAYRASDHDPVVIEFNLVQ
ncbi:MAG: lamin tail domain-containing protein [Gammaproteobacteria bacterium]